MIDHRHEKLYLSQDTYINAYKLPQHQIDDIRFLYKQYKQRSPGVIINDPGGYGKTLPVVLFLNAIKAFKNNTTGIQKPILMLCGESSVSKWKYYLLEKTDFLNTGGVKVKITFCTTTNTATYKRQEWSVMVIDADTVNWVTITNSKDRATFHADYKIWIISEDLKKDLSTLSTIYNWIYQNRKFNPDKFRIKTKNAMDKFTAAARLDYFLHDAVIRGSNFTPKEIAKKISPETSPKQSTAKDKKQVDLDAKMRDLEEKVLGDSEAADLTMAMASGSTAVRSAGLPERSETRGLAQEMELEPSTEAEVTRKRSPETLPKQSTAKNKKQGDLDAKMKDLEEKVLMKFKGSLFDSIF